MSIRVGQKIQSWVANVIIVSLCFPPFSFSATAPTSQATIKIGRIGNWKLNQQQFYSDVARQVQLWVENVDDGVVRVSNKNYRIAANFNPVEQIRFELRRANQQLKVGVLEGKSESLLNKNLELVKNLRKRASKVSDVGPEIRDSLFWEGAYHWMKGNVDLGQSSIERALKIHPEGILPEVSDWDSKEIGTFKVAAFESFVDKLKSSVTRDCSVSLNIEPSDARIRVNGFIWDTKQQLWLASGAVHHIDIEAKDFISQKQLVSCQRLESKKLTVKLINENSENKVAEHDSSVAKTIILLESNDDLLKLFLYTPGKFLDEIPLNRKIKLTSVGLGNIGETNPIISDAMEGLLRKHELIASNLYIGSAESPGLSPAFAAETKLNQREKSWFESPVFWGIVGGVLVGGAITYFATRNDNTGAVNSDWE